MIDFNVRFELTSSVFVAGSSTFPIEISTSLLSF